MYLSPGISEAVVDAFLAKSGVPPDPLTGEREVLQLVAEAKSTRRSRGSWGYKTAELYRTRIMKKISIHGTTGLVRYALRRALVQS